MLLCLSLCVLAQSDIENLHHRDPLVRRHAANIIKLKKDFRAIPYLIEGLTDPEDADVRMACYDALKQLSGKTMDLDARAWDEWWEKEGRLKFPVGEGITDRLEARVRNAEDRIGIYGGVAIGVTGICLVVMVIFVAMVSWRIKSLKELMKQVDAYIKEGKQISERVDAILADVEKKKNDLLEFYGKLKDDSEDEISRYADLLQQKSDHHLREEVMGLRQKAEKELEATLGELKTQMDHEMRKLGELHKKKFEIEANDAHQKFLRDVEANRLFMEGVFYHTNHRFDDALRTYRKLVELKPDHLLAWLKLGDAYREHVQYEEAQDAYKRALDLSPQDSRACYSMAALFAKQKNREKMLEFLRRAIANDGEFKDEALNDQAFREYWNDSAFKDVAES